MFHRVVMPWKRFPYQWPIVESTGDPQGQGSNPEKYGQTHHVNSHYHKTSNIRRTLLGNKIVDHSDVVGASPAGAAPTTSSFPT